MHTLMLVAGENVHEQLLPFSAHAEIQPYEVWLTDDEIKAMAENYKLSPKDLTGLAAKMVDWEKEEGIVKDGCLGRISTLNPDGKYDWYEIGGKWKDFLQLVQPRKLRRFFGLLPAGFTNRVSSAKKSEIIQQALLAAPPMGLLFQGKWIETPLSLEGADEKWRSEFAQHFAQIPTDTTLTVIDVHS